MGRGPVGLLVPGRSFGTFCFDLNFAWNAAESLVDEFRFAGSVLEQTSLQFVVQLSAVVFTLADDLRVGGRNPPLVDVLLDPHRTRSSDGLFKLPDLLLGVQVGSLELVSAGRCYHGQQDKQQTQSSSHFTN